MPSMFLARGQENGGPRLPQQEHERRPRALAARYPARSLARRSRAKPARNSNLDFLAKAASQRLAPPDLQIHARMLEHAAGKRCVRVLQTELADYTDTVRCNTGKT